MQTKICSKCHQKLPIDKFTLNKTRKDGHQTFCIDCQQIYQKQHYKKHKTRYLSKNQKQKKTIKAWWCNYKNTLKCERCGENHIYCLDFHHLNQSKKEYNISSMIYRYGRKTVLKEIEKCIVLCKNCHAKEHHRECSSKAEQ